MSFGGSFQSGLVWGSMFMVNMLNQPKTSPTHNEKTSNKSREMIYIESISHRPGFVLVGIVISWFIFSMESLMRSRTTCALSTP